MRWIGHLLSDAIAFALGACLMKLAYSLKPLIDRRRKAPVVRAFVRKAIADTVCKPETIGVVAGACGVRGCSNMRPHSHVEDYVRRVREK